MDEGTGIARKLAAAAGGDREAARELLPLIYDDLKVVASARLRRLRPGETFTTTDLVHESWLRLVGQGDPGWNGRRHFFGAAARAMRNILVEKVRRTSAIKRESARRRDLSEADNIALDGPRIEDVLWVGDALEKLESEHRRQAEIVWLRYFAGLSMPEVSEVLSISLATAERDLRFARAWLRGQLEREDG